MSSVGISSGLDGNCIISGLESTVFYKDIAGWFRVATIVVWKVTVYSNASDNNIVAVNRMYCPERRVFYSDSFYQNAWTSKGLDAGWTQDGTFAEYTFVYRYKLVSHFAKAVAVVGFNLTPCCKFDSSLCIYCSFSCNGNIIGVVGINHRGVSVKLCAFPACQYDGQKSDDFPLNCRYAPSSKWRLTSLFKCKGPFR